MAHLLRSCTGRVLALLILAAYLFSCTRQVPRGAPETRHFAVEWERLERQQVEWSGWAVEGVPLTPAQWPLEASLKSLVSGDFEGIIDRFDLAFHSSTLEGEVLEDLFEAGYLPVYVRVINTGAEPRVFAPAALTLLADNETRLFAVTPEELPARFEKIDWGATGAAVIVATLTVLLVVLAAKEGRDSAPGRYWDAPARVMVETRTGVPGSRRGALPGPAKPDTRGLLTPVELAPGATSEGFLFFRLDQDIKDWHSVRLSEP
jgi:hypothetical protein